MSLPTTRTRLGALAVAALAASALTVSASPASAAASDGWISGAGSVYDDFGDEGTLSTTSYESSNAACLWQQILWAEGVHESDGTIFDKEDADGHFGANTVHATKQLQKRWGLTADGIVGKNTLGKVDTKREQIGGEWTGRLLHAATNSDALYRTELRYYGKSHTLTFYRTDTGKYYFQTYNVGFAYAAYGHNSCD
ncbi:peptidoglycan-binding protein [Streptomyces sp. YC504]|uniref:Peptidoglycan-binding protein n=1 Tax=Streptomyces mesophilus TaxID=1775132 RepID=A0A6G4XE11_9ACTN|nr:peptidoglycan-binding domain-containing protein [Streptomyces mesophilus]NGO75779.1 peptidoglycan-binding protein [Streptomyces mesophilus]